MKNPFNCLSQFIPEHHKEATIFTICNLFGSLMPLWLGVIIFTAFSSKIDIFRFISNGEFYLYTASLLTTAIYLLYRNKKKNTDLYTILFYISLGLLVISASLFGILTVTNTIFCTKSIRFDPSFLLKSSNILFLISIPISYVAQVLQNKSGPNVALAAQEDLVKLEHRFDEVK